MACLRPPKAFSTLLGTSFLLMSPWSCSRRSPIPSWASLCSMEAAIFLHVISGLSRLYVCIHIFFHSNPVTTIGMDQPHRLWESNQWVRLGENKSWRVGAISCMCRGGEHREGNKRGTSWLLSYCLDREWLFPFAISCKNIFNKLS